MRVARIGGGRRGRTCYVHQFIKITQISDQIRMNVRSLWFGNGDECVVLNTSHACSIRWRSGRSLKGRSIILMSDGIGDLLFIRSNECQTASGSDSASAPLPPDRASLLLSLALLRPWMISVIPMAAQIIAPVLRKLRWIRNRLSNDCHR